MLFILAKDVPAVDLQNITARLVGASSGNSIYYTQEVVYENTGPVLSSEYTSIGSFPEVLMTSDSI